MFNVPSNTIDGWKLVVRNQNCSFWAVFADLRINLFFYKKWIGEIIARAVYIFLESEIKQYWLSRCVVLPNLQAFFFTLYFVRSPIKQKYLILNRWIISATKRLFTQSEFFWCVIAFKLFFWFSNWKKCFKFYNGWCIETFALSFRINSRTRNSQMRIPHEQTIIIQIQ